MARSGNILGNASVIVSRNHLGMGQMATENIPEINECEYCYENYAVSMGDEECLVCGNCGQYDMFGVSYNARP